MPSDYSIALEIGRGADRPVADRGPRRQSMRGFEDTYVDIVDYIVRITHRIWEDQDIGYIYDTYAPACRVYDDGGPRHGIEQMVTGTIQRISAFPDMRHYADEVIWAGNDEQGFVTSHRALNIGHHTGAVALGAGDGTQGQQLGDRQLRRRRQRDLRGVGAVQHGRPAAPARHRRAGRGPGARQLGGAGIARRA